MRTWQYQPRDRTVRCCYRYKDHGMINSAPKIMRFTAPCMTVVEGTYSEETNN